MGNSKKDSICWKIPKEWVLEWGLTATEAIVLADILSHPDCNYRERAGRCGVSIGKISSCIKVYKNQKIILKIGQPFVQILNNLCSKNEQICSENEQKTSSKKEGNRSGPIKGKGIKKEDVTAAIKVTRDRVEEKAYSVIHQCRLAFVEQYLQFKGEEYYYAAKDAHAVKQLIAKIKSKMPDDLKENEEEIVQNFKIFIHAIIHSGKVERWVLDNLSLPIINSKFNEIYSQLKNGTAKQPNPTDIHRVFGSRNIDAGILEFLT